MDEDSRIAALSAVPDDTTFLFRVRPVDDESEREAILVTPPDGDDGDVVAWLNYCQHFTHIKLDKSSGAPMRDGELVCANHGAYFESDTGYCTFGPCEGAYLDALDVTVADGAVYLTDDDYAFAGTGGIETDDADLTSKSNYEF
ncbi:MAG: Rieske (2Fe-2S) protein [Haloarculaceae archaeon]